MGDRGVARTEGEPLIEEVTAAQTREEGDIPGTPPPRVTPKGPWGVYPPARYEVLVRHLLPDKALGEAG